MSNVLRGRNRLAAPAFTLATLVSLGGLGCSSAPEHEAPDTTVAAAPTTEALTIHDHAQTTLERLAGRVLEEAQKGDKHEVIGDRTIDKKVELPSGRSNFVVIETTVDTVQPPTHSEYMAVVQAPETEPVENYGRTANWVAVTASNVPGRVLHDKRNFQIQWSMRKDHKGEFNVVAPGTYSREHHASFERPLILDTDASGPDLLNPPHTKPPSEFTPMTEQNLAEQVQLADQRLDSMHDGLSWPAIS